MKVSVSETRASVVSIINIDSDLLVVVERKLFKSRNRAQECDASSRNDIFFHRGTSRMHRVFDAGLLFLDFDFGRRAHFDDRHTADELRQLLLQLFAIVAGACLFHLIAKLFHTPFYSGALTAAFDNGGVVLIDDDLFRRTQILQSDILNLIPRSSVIERPLVRIAISSSIAFRRLPTPGAFTAADCNVPRNLFRTSIASASPSISSAMTTVSVPTSTPVPRSVEGLSCC